MPYARQTERLQDLRDRRQILIQAPNLDAHRDAVCGEVLSMTPPDRTDVLMVMLSEAPDAAVERWRTHVSGDQPAKMGVITINEMTRAAASHSSVTPAARNVSVGTIADPRNLTTLGVRLTEQLSEWHGDGNHSVVCFDSLTQLLQHVDRQQAFKFLHTLKSWLAHHDGTAHYHLDPTAIDDQTTNTMATLMDAIVEIDADGDLTLSMQ